MNARLAPHRLLAIFCFSLLLLLLHANAAAQCQGPPASAPTITATAGIAQVTLTWGAVNDATQYEVFRSDNGGQFANHGGSNTTSVIDALVSNGATYAYYVVAQNICGGGPASNIVSATVNLDAPSVTATPGKEKITVTWSTVTGATAYKICWADTNNPTGIICSVVSTGTSIEYSGPPFYNGHTYTFFGRAINAAGDSPNSASVSAGINLRTPKGLIARLDPNSLQVTVSWSSVPDAESYVILRSLEGPTGPWLDFRPSGPGTSFVDTYAWPETRYYFVIAQNDAGQGPPSAVVNTGDVDDSTCYCGGALPYDHGGAGNNSGAQAHDPVNLATGREDYQPQPDLSAYNPTGPAVAWQRSYHGSQALKGYASPGLSAGWVHNYDVMVQGTAGTWGALKLTYQTGSVETLTPVLDGGGQPTGVLTPPAGLPYFVRGVAGASAGVWQSVTVTWKDQSQWRFTLLAGGTYALSRISNRMGQSIDLTWNSSRALMQVSDTASSATLLTLAYRSDGQLASVTDAYNRQVVYGYDAPFGSAPGLLQTVSQVVAAGTANPPARWTFSYESARGQQLQTITVPNPAGSGTATAALNYDVTGKVTSLVDANGNQRIYTYNTGNTGVQIKTAANAVVQTWTQKFNADRRDTGSTDASNQSTTAEYNDAQNPTRPTRVVDKNGKATTYTYDSFGNVLTMTTPRNVPTTYTWSYTAFALGRLMSVQEGTKPATTFAYFEPSGLLQSVTMPALNSGSGTVTSGFTYDSLGNVLTATTPGNNATTASTTTYNYTTDGAYTQTVKVGQPLKVTDNLGHVTHMRYDAQGRGTSAIDALGNETDATYNLAGQVETVTLPATNQTGTGHGRTVNAYLYVGGPPMTSTIYDESNAQVRQVTRSYGPEGELLSVTGSTEPVSYTYDALYRLKTLKDGKNNTTTYSYNSVGYVAQVQMPGGETVQFPSYDYAGHLLQRIDGNNVTINYLYADAENQLTDIQYPASTSLNVHFSYDGYGRRGQMTDATGSQTYTYGNRDELLSHTTTYSSLDPQTIGYSYYPNGSRQTMTTPVGDFAYAYDAAGRMTSLTNPYSETSSWTYYNNDWLHTQTLANGAQTSYTYNALGQMLDLINEQGSVTLSEFQVTQYDGAGNRKETSAAFPQLLTLDGSTLYTYDTKDQMTSEKVARSDYDFTDTFGYDAAGNATSFKGVTKSYNANNQQSGTGYTHDNNGNPTSYKGMTLSFDPENRLTSYGGVLTAKYTGDGLRAWKQPGATGKRYFLYDGSLPVLEVNKDGVALAVNTFGANGLVSRTESLTSTFYTFDLQGSVAQRLDYAGNALSSHLFTAHGSEQTTPAADPFGYGAQWGYYTDRETRLQLLTHRYYDPSNGRFLTRDPISYNGGINLYGYVANSVVNDIDPDGLDGISHLRPQIMPPDPKGGGTKRRIIDPPPSSGGGQPPSAPSGPAAGGSSDCGCQTAFPRLPDYLSIGGGIPFPVPFQFAGASLSFTLARSGDVYFSLGPAAGLPSVGGLTGSAGWLNQRCVPTAGELDGFLKGWTFSGGGNFFGTPIQPFVGGAWTPGHGTATNLGGTFGGSPSMVSGGGSLTGGIHLFNIGRSW